jgi:hypothetical protein
MFQLELTKTFGVKAHHVCFLSQGVGASNAATQAC